MHVWAIRRFGSKRKCLGEWVRRWRIRGVWSQQQLAFAFSLQCQLWAFVGKVNSKFILILIRGLCCQPWEFVIDFNRFVLSSITDELKREKLEVRGGDGGGTGGPFIDWKREECQQSSHLIICSEDGNTNMHKSIFPNLIVRLLSLSYHISLSTDNSLISLFTRILIGRE